MNWIRNFAIALCMCSLSFVLADESTNSEHQFKGVHFLASYCDCDEASLRDWKALEAAMYNAVEECGATILESSSWVFPPDGLTMVILLSESHASIHTYPEHNACFVDLFTCGDNCSAETFDAVMQAYLKPQTVNQRTVVRHREIEEK